MAGGTIVGKPDFKNLLPQHGLGIGEKEMPLATVTGDNGQNLTGKAPPYRRMRPTDGVRPHHHGNFSKSDLAGSRCVEPDAAPNQSGLVDRGNRRDSPATIKQKAPRKKRQVTAVPGAQPRDRLPGLGFAPGDHKSGHGKDNHDKKKRHRKWHVKPPDSRLPRRPFSGCHDNPDS